jgi:outer membrane protein insertion porin family
VRRPTIYKSAQSGQANQEQPKSPYAGRQIGSLAFRGNQHVPSATILDFLEVKKGDPYSAERFESDMDRLRVLLFGRRGYLKATVGEPQIEDSLNGLEIVVPIQEGVVYRLGEIKVEDATLFSPEEIIQIVGLKSGETVDGYGFQQGLSKLDTLYRNSGYFQFNVGFIPDFKQTSPDAEEGVVDISLELEEGELFRINTIQFEGKTYGIERADISA